MYSSISFFCKKINHIFWRLHHGVAKISLDTYKANAFQPLITHCRAQIILNPPHDRKCALSFVLMILVITKLTKPSSGGDIIVLYCIVSIHFYSASCSAHQSEALPVRETQREESSLERTKRGTWLTS